LPLQLRVDDNRGGGHQAPAFGLVEGHEQPIPSIEPGIIDNLAQPIACSLILMVGGSFEWR
jgi:hypothetical protein